MAGEESRTTFGVLFAEVAPFVILRSDALDRTEESESNEQILHFVQNDVCFFLISLDRRFSTTG
jgi:hypothetical protein